jgi:hypothetical protein
MVYMGEVGEEDMGEEDMGEVYYSLRLRHLHPAVHLDHLYHLPDRECLVECLRLKCTAHRK